MVSRLCDTRIGDFLLSYKVSNAPTSDETGEKSLYAKDRIICPKFLRALAAEFIALALFVPIAVGSSIPWTGRNTPSNTQIAFANGLMIATLIQCFAHVSGAHFNPAVTIPLTWNRDVSIIRAVCYIIAQCLGSALGGLVLQRVTPIEVRTDDIGCSLLGENVSPWQGFLLEFVITFQLVFMVFATIDPSRDDVKGSAAIGVGFSVVAGLLYGLPYTGASMNPARSFGPALVTGVWTYHWVYWAAPITAGLCAGNIYSFIFANDASGRKLRQRMSCGGGGSDGDGGGRSGGGSGGGYEQPQKGITRTVTQESDIRACNSV
ncbi:aquaporin AQPAe.a-like [Amphiura filiformis]|uniref:aquaporin AQPAe.a-like n=1 Tax=Amphiura filiformis TaxID=82378 RepID=UPI003B221E0D